MLFLPRIFNNSFFFSAFLIFFMSPSAHLFLFKCSLFFSFIFRLLISCERFSLNTPSSFRHIHAPPPLSLPSFTHFITSAIASPLYPNTGFAFPISTTSSALLYRCKVNFYGPFPGEYGNIIHRPRISGDCDRNFLVSASHNALLSARFNNQRQLPPLPQT